MARFRMAPCMGIPLPTLRLLLMLVSSSRTSSGERGITHWQRHSEIPLEIAYTRQGNQVAFINELPEMKKAQPSGLFHVWMILHADVSLFFQDGIFFWGVA